MQTRRLYLHIGTEKTGTSSIQKVLRNNRPALAELGLHFLKSAGVQNNRALPACCMDDDKYDDYLKALDITTAQQKLAHREKVQKDLKEELLSLPEQIQTVIISSEHFHSRNDRPAEIQRVRELLSAYFDDIQVICYLREQSSTCESLYSTLIKAGLNQSFEQVLQQCRPDNIRYNYFNMLSNWADIFGLEHLTVRKFEKASMLNGNVIEDFLAQINGVIATRLELNVDNPNESLTPLGQCLGRAVNQMLPGKGPDGKPNQARIAAFQNLHNDFSGKGRLVSAAQYDEIYSAFAQSNEKLNARFFGGSGNYFDYRPPAIEGNETTPMDDSLVEKLCRVMQHISASGIVLDDSYADLFRDTAIHYEEQDLGKSLQFMELALLLRPGGPLIQRKLAEYREKLAAAL